jgi:4-amino-4-deoxy-L-arabinose transferase-like glycosyltransferase
LNPALNTAADRRHIVWLLLAAAVVLGAGIGLRDPWPADEPRFALVARQMVESGQLLFPHRGSELYPDKPPLMMWLQAIGYAATGSLRVGFLLPSLLAGLATLWLVWDLGRRLYTPRAGLLAAIGVLSAFMFTFQFKRAQIDPVVVALITLANWGLLRHLLLGPDWRMFWLGCFAAGLGVITKGVGVIALLMLVPYALARRRGWQGLATTDSTGDGRRWAGGAAAFLGAIALWLVPMASVALARGTPETLAYMHNILFHQTAGRYTGQIPGHERPIWYFGPVVLLHFLPLSIVLLAAWRDWRAGWQARDGRTAVLLGWCALVLLFFTLADGKREVYVLPMLPMLALAMAPTLERVAQARWLHRTAWAAALAMGAALLAAGWRARHGDWPQASRLMLERGLEQQLGAIGAIGLVLGGVFVLAALLGRPARGVQALLTGLAALWIAYGVALVPLANDAVSARTVMQRADALAGPDEEIALVAWREQHLLMAPRPMRDFGFRQPDDVQLARGAAWAAEVPQRRWIFADARRVRACVDERRVQPVGYANRRLMWMMRADAIKPGCTLGPPRAERNADDDDGG